ISGLLQVLVLLYLLLSTGDLFFRKIMRLMPLRKDKAAAIDILEESQSVVMRYVVVTFFINLGQAAVVGVVMWYIGMPTPILWAVFTLVIEFIPYFGAAIIMVFLSVVAFATFDSVGRVIAVPGMYFLISTIQNNVVSPYAYGSRLKLNPVAVLLGVLFWWFIWGISGAFLAIPIIATIKVIADRTETLPVLSELLGE
ncbi:MAG TPA: AI-2E family transporter, partial [Roseimicrobium sp.]|nr:AI-2E family transporter [Roseimicrobium sp.]